jgi:hypothetical protein
MSVSDWLDAHDGDAVAAAWQALDPRMQEVGLPSWTVTAPAAARFAATFLGWPIERLAWIAAEADALPPPTFELHHEVTRCYLEHLLDYRGECHESWKIREVAEGPRGVQLVTVDFFYDDGSREGFGMSNTVVRVFDRDAGTAASIDLHARTVATVGAMDLSALDLFDVWCEVRLGWPYVRDDVRGVLAQLASDVDAHFDVSATWPGRTLDAGAVEATQWEELRFESGDFAIELVEHHYETRSTVLAKFFGLPWGHAITVVLRDDGTGMEGNVQLRLPRVDCDALLARAAAVPNLVLTKQW